MDDRIGQFLQFLSVEKGASENTIAAYRNDLAQFHSFLSTINLNGNATDWRRVGSDAVLSFMVEMRTKRYADATVARKVAAVKSFFQFLHAEGDIPLNPTEDLESPRVGKSLPKPLTVQQVDELLEQPAKRATPEALRDRGMLELLYATGLRVSEMVSLNVDNVSLDSHNPYVRCIGKGSKERLVPIHGQALRAVAAYLEDGRRRLLKDQQQGALFLNRRGDRLTRQGFWLILKQYARDAHLDEVLVTPHTLRHSFATHMLRGGAPLRSVQELLGHANLSTTQIYTQVTNDHVRRVYEQAHPRAR
ncbi:MAG: site-specific tyrosine recombinase XerD [Dehalococcoidia bacterium]